MPSRGKRDGELAQLGERRLCKPEVTGSSPVFSTKDISMGKYEKLLLKILSGASDKNIQFDDICKLMTKLGFTERIRGSHHIFRKGGITELVNLQRDNSKAKAYQVRSVRDVILKYNLKGEIDV